MNSLARTRGLTPAGRSFSRLSAVHVLFLLSSLWIGGRATASAQPPPPASSRPAAPEAAEAQAAPDEAVLIDASRAFREGLYDRVTEIVDRAAAPSPPLVALKGQALAARGKYEEALTLLSAASAKAPGSEATLQLGLLLQQRLGRRQEAADAFAQVLRTYAPDIGTRDLLRIARAVRALGQSRQANTIYQRAANAAGRGEGGPDPAVQTAWGELFLEKYNTNEAVDAFRAALKADSRWVEAQLGLARALVDEAPDRAAEAANAVLSINKSSVEARLILAELALDERKLDEAGQEIARAQEVNPSSLEAWALQASIAHLRGQPQELEVIAKKALAINPRYGDIYRIPGAQAASHYRFDDAVALVRRGLGVDPDSARAQADLGMHLLRTGDEAGARAALDKAFKQDAYDVVTYNLLAMLDGLDKFETIREGDLVIRLHPNDVRVLKAPLLKIARESLDRLSMQYGFTPTGPILIEAFPRHDDFAVRTLGLPGMIGALGVCFGRVVTLDSPRARPPGSFNWSQTLWHELAHVITLQMSEQRVPRWLTEGISVFETRRARPEWGREGEFDFLNAMARGELIKVADLNSGFSSGRTIGVAYHESSLLVEHLVELHGDAGLQRMLKAYGEGLDTDAVLKRTLGTDTDTIQRSFDQFLDARFGRARAALQPIEAEPPSPDADAETVRAFASRYDQNYPVQLRAGRVLLEKGDLDGAQAAFERAASLVPQTMGDGSARAGLAEVAEKRGDPARAMTELTTVLGESYTGLESARRLATLARDAKDDAAERRAIERILALDPFDASVHASLGRLALAQQDVPAAMEALQLALDLGAQDAAAVHTDMAEAYLVTGNQAQVRQHAIAALEIAPRFERAQELLLKVTDAQRP